MEEKIRLVREEAFNAVNTCSGIQELESVKLKYLSRKGIVASLFQDLSKVEKEKKPIIGKELNELKSSLSDLVENKMAELKTADGLSGKEDLTLPVNPLKLPSAHPIKSVMEDIIDIFTSMGFGVAYGPEIEEEFYNFTALNIPAAHPARDMHDTFYLEGGKKLLRTHTSPVQVHVMTSKKPPYKFIAPGKCYRRDTIDATHSPVFHQVEGLMVDRDISFADLKGVLEEFARRIFQDEIKTRFRPSFFPFTEPSAELDIMCGICNGKGCPSCGHSGWLEILGSGMVDPAVFSHCGLESSLWQGFAFGMGVERIAMLKYGITDMRLFYQNDIRFLEQF